MQTLYPCLTAYFTGYLMIMRQPTASVSSGYSYENHLSIKIKDLRHDIVILQDTAYNEDRRTGGYCMRNHEVTQRHPLLDEHGSFEKRQAGPVHCCRNIAERILKQNAGESRNGIII